MDEFVGFMEEAMERMPEQFASAVENVAFLALPEPDGGDFHRLKLSHPERDFGYGEILGLYSGVPLTERSFTYAREPDIIKLFAGPICRTCGNRDSVKNQVYRTLVHEVAHYFGMTDAEIRQMGY